MKRPRATAPLLPCRHCGHAAETVATGVRQQQRLGASRGSIRRTAVVLADDRFDRGDGPEPACAWATKESLIAPHGTRRGGCLPTIGVTTAIHHPRRRLQARAGHVASTARGSVEHAVQAGNFPAVSFIKNIGIQDGHAGYSDPLDEQTAVVELINFLESQPSWSNTAVVILYDDSDGWYDHQMSPIVNQSTGSADALTGPNACGTAAFNCPASTRTIPTRSVVAATVRGNR